VEITIVDGLRTIKFDLVLTLALAALALFVGYGVQRRVPFLARSSVPAPAIGGLLFALIVLALHARGTFTIALDTSLRAPLQTVFFTTIGLGATASLLRAGGKRMAFFWLIASMTAVVQNLVGIGLARAMNAPLPLGIICGALTLTGGPATGLARATDFEKLGISGAGALIIASATFGIFTASLVGNPTATWLIRRFHLWKPRAESEMEESKPDDDVFWAVGPIGDGVLDETEHQLHNVSKNFAEQSFGGRRIAEKKVERERIDERRDEEARVVLSGATILRTLMLLLLVMGLGALLGQGLTQLSVMLPGVLGALLKLPAYIGAMIVAALVRNLDDRYGWFKLNARAAEVLGVIALSLFLVIALMDLKPWELARLAVPMLVILFVQVLLMIVYAVLVTFVLMGRDYEAAVMASGHIGFGLGTTPNAVTNMEALVERFGAAPQSFLIVPVVGAFFIDLTNALVINLFINFL
jgi:ESS family glutamate:Na+ symporter